VRIALLAAAAALIASNKLETVANLRSRPSPPSAFFVAAGFLRPVRSRQVRFLLPGARPKSIFCTDVAHHRSLRAALIHSAERAISHNMTRVIRSAEMVLRLALFIAGARRPRRPSDSSLSGWLIEEVTLSDPVGRYLRDSRTRFRVSAEVLAALVAAAVVAAALLPCS